MPSGYFSFDVPKASECVGYRRAEFGIAYAELVDILRRTAARLSMPVAGFHDMSVEEVARDCGISLLQARLAKLREYGEPFGVIAARRDGRRRLARALTAAGFECASEGRYDHLGVAGGVRAGVDLICALFRREFRAVRTVGVGQTLRDVPMLRLVDMPFVVRDERSATPLQVLAHVPRARLTDAGGTTGWLEAIRAALVATVRS